MTFIPAVDCAELVLKGVDSGVPIANVVNFLKPGGYSQGDIDSLAAVGDLWWDASYKPLVTTGVTYNNSTVRGLASQTDLSAIDGAHTGPGTASGSGLPANCTLAVSLRTGFTGRTARGRFYAWPMSLSTLINPNTFGATYTNAMVNALLALRTNAAAAGWTMVIVSRYLNGAARTSAVARTVTTIYVTDAIIDTMRRRLH